MRSIYINASIHNFIRVCPTLHYQLSIRAGDHTPIESHRIGGIKNALNKRQTQIQKCWKQ